jgi:hypothetical protein
MLKIFKLQQALPEVIVQGQTAPLISYRQGFLRAQDAVCQEGVNEMGIFGREIRQWTVPSMPKLEKAAQRGKPCGRHRRP